MIKNNPYILILGTGPKYKLPYIKHIQSLGNNLVVMGKDLNWLNESEIMKVFSINTDNTSEVMAVLDKNNLTNKISGVITLFEHDVINASKVAQILNLPGLSQNAARIARDKSLMREKLASIGYTPNFKIVESFADFVDAVNQIGIPGVLKPSGMSASINVRYIENNSKTYLKNIYDECAEIKEKTTKQFNLHKDDFKLMIYEQFITGDEYSVEGYVQNNIYFPIGILKKNKFQLEGTFHPTGDIAPIKEKESEEYLQNVAKVSAEKFGLNNCLVHAEVKKTPENEYFLIELGARPIGMYGMTMLKYAYGVDLFEIYLDIAKGIEVKNPVKIKKPTIAHIVNPYKKGILRRFVFPIEEIKKYAQDNEISVDYFKIVNENENTIIPPEGFQHLGWLMVASNSFEKSQEVLNNLVAKIDLTIE